MSTNRLGRTAMVAFAAAAALAVLPTPAAHASPLGTTISTVGASLVPFTTTTVITAFDAPTYCSRVRVPGYTVEKCGKANTAIGTVIWSRQRNSAGIRRLYVFEQVAKDKWKPKLRSIEPYLGDWLDAKGIAGDIDGDGKQELVMGIRPQGTGGFLLLDIIDIRSAHVKVTGVLALTKGGARLETGRLRTFEAFYLAGEPGCCPSKIDWNRVEFNSATGKWKVTSRALRSATAPLLYTSQF